MKMDRASLIRGILLPFRHLVVMGRRGQLHRSASVLILRPFSTSSSLTAGLSVLAPIDRPELRFAMSDSMVLRAVYWFGVQGYEGILTRVWELLCRQSTAVLEVGGNIGLYAVLGGSQKPKRYSVLEPIPLVADQIRKNLLLNRLDGVEVLQVAAIPMRVSQPVQMNVPAEADAIPVGAHLVEGVEVTGRSSCQVLTVTGIPFADLAADRDLIKIDAEGIEAILLESAIEVLAIQRPTLVIEVLPESEHLSSVLKRLALDLSYRIYVVPAYGTDVPVEVAPEEFNSRFPSRHRSKDVVLTRIDLNRLLADGPP